MTDLMTTWGFWITTQHFAIGDAACGPLAGLLPAALDRYCPRMIDGVLTTFELVTLALLTAFLIARGLTARYWLSGPWVRRGIDLYLWVFQGTPLLIQLWLLYFGLAQFEGLRSSALWVILGSGWWVGLITLTLNSAAYQTAILLGAIRNLPDGQAEGASALGLSRRAVYRTVLFPQAARSAWPSLANEGILLLKASALVSTITVLDLMGHARTVFSRSYQLEVYGYAALLYIGLTGLMTLLAFAIRRYGFRGLPSDPWFQGRR